jgi:hypothetical protein
MSRVFLLFAAACAPSVGPGGGPADPTDPTGTPAPTPPAPTTPDTETDTDTPGTPPTSSTGIPMVEADCEALLPVPASYVTLGWSTGSEDYALDLDGNHVGVVGGTLFETPWGGPRVAVAPGLSDSIRGSRILADGTVVLSDPEHQTLVGVDPDTGGSWIIASDVENPNGIAIGADGWIYAALTGSIARFDPATGDREVVADMPGNSFDGLTFMPDYKSLYFDEEFGQVWKVTFDEDNNPSEPNLGPDIPVGGFSLLDGMTADACFNLYVVEMNGTVWRASPDGSVTVALDINGFASTSAVNFGSGIGGWETTTLYLSDFLGKMYAAPLGVPGKWEPYMGFGP